MGVTNQIKGTNLSLQLYDKKCPQCQQLFTKQEIDDRNFDLWFDTTNEVSLIPMEKLSQEEVKHLYFPIKQSGYQFTIWIRSIEHEFCPDTEPCQGCNKRFLVEKMINPKGNFDYYCSPCYQQISPNIKNYEPK